jgi:hypothetical protein
LNGEGLSGADNISDIADYDHDSVEPSEVFSVVDANSSQQDAILLAKRGVSFVLQGPHDFSMPERFESFEMTKKTISPN